MRVGLLALFFAALHKRNMRGKYSSVATGRALRSEGTCDGCWILSAAGATAGNRGLPDGIRAGDRAFGARLNLNVHVHTLVRDGVFTETATRTLCRRRSSILLEGPLAREDGGVLLVNRADCLPETLRLDLRAAARLAGEFDPDTTRWTRVSEPRVQLDTGWTKWVPC